MPIPYSRLRDKNRAKTGKVSLSLLASIAEKSAMGAKKLKNKGESIMSQNVTQYRHMLNDAHCKENYVKWAINLR